MNNHPKCEQSLIDFIQTAPLSSFRVRHSPISNKEAQVLYDIWMNNDQYVRTSFIDPLTVSSLITKGYVKNKLNSLYGDSRKLEFTSKGKDVIRKIILFKEKSSFEKSSRHIDYESICLSEISNRSKKKKTASRLRSHYKNWLMKVL